MTDKTETNSPVLDCVMMRLSMDPRQLDQMQRQCLSLDGAKSRAEWLLKADPALRAEFTSVSALAGLLLNRARNGVGVFGNVLAVSKP
jgi:hypothetical protein